MQNESFLEYQRQLNSRCGRDNAQSLFGRVRPLVDKSCCNQGSTGNPY
jgi:hypothetical protein